MKKIIFLLPLLGLASCVAPKAGDDAAAPVVAENKPLARPQNVGGPSADALGKAETSAVKTVDLKAKPARPKPLLSSLFAKKETPGEEPKVKPAPVPVSDPAVTPAATPPERKSFFSFLRKKEPPRAIVVETPAPRKSSRAAKAEDALPELPKSEDDGLRLPDMLTMPDKKDFESTNPSAVKPRGDGAVIARPPTDPPARSKPKDESP